MSRNMKGKRASLFSTNGRNSKCEQSSLDSRQQKSGYGLEASSNSGLKTTEMLATYKLGFATEFYPCRWT